MLRDLRYNIKAIIGSLIIAFLLWFIVATEKEYTHQIEIPIELVRLAKGKTLKNEIPGKVLLEVKGKGRAFIGLWFYDEKLRLDLPQVKRSQEIWLRDYTHFLDLPGLTALQIIDPEKIVLEVDDVLAEKKPVVFNGSIGTENGYILIDYYFNMDSVFVYGPKSIVRQISQINTDTLRVEKEKNRFKQTVQLISPHTKLIKLNPDQVTIDFDIQRLIERVVYDIPITIKNIPSYLDVEVIPNTLSLRIKGGQDIIAKVTPELIKAEIDFSKNYRRRREKYGAHIITPDNISWIESIPKTFKLKVKRK